MTHFMEKITGMGTHAVEMAVIINGRGCKVGRVGVRYTKAVNGWNHEIGLWTHEPIGGNFRSKKGGAYARDTLFLLLEGIGAKCYDYHEKRLTAELIAETSQFSEIEHFKVGGKKYRIVWF